VRRILFDENLPRLLRRDLPEFSIRTVQEEGWGSYQNGQLLRRAETAFDVLLTADRRMEYQQHLASFSIGIVVIVTPRLRLQELRSVLNPVRAALADVKAGEIIRITVE
jgi:predicted nuclease of predicted toxin-antitoxin system